MKLGIVHCKSSDGPESHLEQDCSTVNTLTSNLLIKLLRHFSLFKCLFWFLLYEWDYFLLYVFKELLESYLFHSLSFSSLSWSSLIWASENFTFLSHFSISFLKYSNLFLDQKICFPEFSDHIQPSILLQLLRNCLTQVIDQLFEFFSSLWLTQQQAHQAINFFTKESLAVQPDFMVNHCIIALHHPLTPEKSSKSRRCL